MTSLSSFREVWFVDFEFHQPDGELPNPVCMVAREYRTGRTLRLWGDELRARREPPVPVGPDSLLVAYYASAELSCYLALGWPLPVRVLDLYAEFRCMTTGRKVPCGRSLLGALTYHGLDAIEATEKAEMQNLAQRGGPYTTHEKEALLDYCESDVVALAKLLPVMLTQIDLARAVLRGRYMAAAARIERAGIPIDVPTFEKLKSNWEAVQDRLITEIDTEYGIYEGRTFKMERFAGWLARTGIPWPRLDSGMLDTRDGTFRDMARSHPRLAPLRELRYSLSQLRLSALAVGGDGCNRCLLSAFAAKTGRNQPSNSRFAFGPSVWLRGLIKPKPGRAIAYVDWEQQEFGIAAALSGDEVMMEAYSSGDPYLAFAKQAGAVPPDATKTSHKEEHDLFKSCALGIQYGMGEKSLAQRIGRSPADARQLLELHHRTYPTFWRWSDAAVDHGMLFGKLHTVFGWRIHVGPDAKPAELPDAGQRRRDAPTGLLPGHRARDRSLRPRARRGAHRGRGRGDR